MAERDARGGWDVTVDEARARLLDAVRPTAIERLSLFDALDLTLAADVTSPMSLPPFDTAAVDGYAVRAAETERATPSQPIPLAIAGEAWPGAVGAARVDPGRAVRVLTGAPVPVGATAIVPFENTDEVERDRSRRTIRILASTSLGDGIRLAGSALPVGAVALRQGQVLGPSQLGVLASLGLSDIDAHRRPRIALISVGDQFMAPGTDLGPARIYDGNQIALAGAVRAAGGIPLPLGIVADRVEAIADRLATAVTADVVVASGGVTHGSSDVMKDVLTERGRVGFWRVAMRPGRPSGFGRIGEQPVVALPGNPGGALIAFEQLVRPMVRKLLGRERVLRPEVAVVVRGHAANADGRCCFLPARVENAEGMPVATLASARSGATGARAEGLNALVILPESRGEVRDGDSLRAQLLTWED